MKYAVLGLKDIFRLWSVSEHLFDAGGEKGQRKEGPEKEPFPLQQSEMRLKRKMTSHGRIPDWLVSCATTLTLPVRRRKWKLRWCILNEKVSLHVFSRPKKISHQNFSYGLDLWVPSQADPSRWVQ